MSSKTLAFITTLAIPASLFLASTAASDIEQVIIAEPVVNIAAKPVSVVTTEPVPVDALIVEEETVETVGPVKQTKSTKTIDTADVVTNNPDETIFRIMESQSGAPWGLDRVDGARDGTYNYVSTGSGVRIYIVDTGVDASHPEFGGRVTRGFDAFGEGLADTDCQGHGTHIAGIAAGSYFGVAKSATIVPVRVLDCNGIGTTSTLTSGIEWILANHGGGVGIVNMSLGGEQDDTVNAITSRLSDAGLVVVVAAGNAGQDACNYSPASARGAIAVAAIDTDDSRASFSNYGSCVDISAPGVGINSANADNYSISKKMSGTSQASPFVAGAIATYLSKGSASNRSQAEALMNELAQNGIVMVESEPQESVEPTPEPIVEPEPVTPEPEPFPSPVVNEPIVPEYDVSVIAVEDGPMFGLLSWSQISSSSGYKIYRTSPERPTWKVYGAFTDNLKTEMLIVTDVGKFARYRVVAIIDSKEIEIGEITHAPVN